jgi:uroporphyrinogen-III synthase
MAQKAILVTRGEDGFSSMLRDAGFEVINLELIRTRQCDDLTELYLALSRLSEYDALVFTSPVAAEIFVSERNGSNAFNGSVYALGQRAQAALIRAGLKVEPSGARTAEELVDSLPDPAVAGKRFLFFRGEKSLRTVPDKLGDRASVHEVVVYKTEPREIPNEVVTELKHRIRKGDIESICFFSPSGVERFAELFQDVAKVPAGAALGTTTADAVRRAGMNLSIVSPHPIAEEFANCLIDHLKKH